jgi:hypothetical protein
MPYIVVILVAAAVMGWDMDREIRKLDRRIAELEKQYGVQGGANGE